MGKEYECCGQIIEVLRGEAINNRNTGMLLYAAMCRCNRNLLYVVREMLPDRTGEDHVNDVLSHLYDIPQQYAMDCLAGYAPVFVTVFRRGEEASYYHIFGGYDVEPLRDSDLGTIMKWVMEHNDYAEPRYMYTEIVDGHQAKTDFNKYTGENKLN